MTPVRLEPAALQSRVKHSTTKPLRSLTGPMQTDYSTVFPIHSMAVLTFRATDGHGEWTVTGV